MGGFQLLISFQIYWRVIQCNFDYVICVDTWQNLQSCIAGSLKILHKCDCDIWFIGNSGGVETWQTVQWFCHELLKHSCAISRKFYRLSIPPSNKQDRWRTMFLHMHAIASSDILLCKNILLWLFHIHTTHKCYSCLHSLLFNFLLYFLGYALSMGTWTPKVPQWQFQI